MNENVDPIAYYDSKATVFANQASDTQANWFEYQKNMPSLLKLCDPLGGRVLDFGCGAGNFTTLFQRKGRIVEGSDASSKLLDIARRNNPGITFFHSRPDGKIETEKQYDLIVSKLVFHYIIDLKSVLLNLNKLQNIHSHLLFSVPHPDKTQINFDSQTEEGVYLGKVGNFGLTLPMVHRNLDKLSMLLEESGYDITETSIVYDKDKPIRLNILAKKLG